MFNRRKNKDTPSPTPVRPPDQPDVWMLSEEQPHAAKGSVRYFFIEQLTPDGAKSLERSLAQQLVSVDHFQLETSTNAVMVSWFMKKDEKRSSNDVAEEVKLITVGALADHFGWEDPEVGTFSSGEERFALAKKLGVSWTLNAS